MRSRSVEHSKIVVGTLDVWENSMGEPNGD